MKVKKLIWLEEIVDKIISKHNVQPEEVRQILGGRPYFRFMEKGHREGEQVYAALGQTDSGRYLIVFYVFKKDKSALILSARDMTFKEKKRYEQR